MKRLLIVAIAAVLVFGLGATAATAAGNSLHEGSFGFSVGMGDSLGRDTQSGGAADAGVVALSARYFLANDLAILAGLGVQSTSGDQDRDYFGIFMGARYYLGTADFSTFLGGRLSIVSREHRENNGATVIEDTDIMDLGFEFGAEYFIGSQFSMEGSVGLGFGTADDNTRPNNDYTYFGTRAVGVMANFYF
jgi:hypothetical protein